MDLLAVVLELAVLLLIANGAQRLLDVAAAVLAADHETNLAARVGRDRGPSVLSNGKDGLAVFLELLNDAQVEPWVLSYIATKTTR